MMLCTSANAQDKIVPMTIPSMWPISSPLLDSVEYYSAKNISASKIKMIELINDSGAVNAKIYYDKTGKEFLQQEIVNNKVAIEVLCERNTEGQITRIETKNITGEFFFKPNSIETFEYKNNIPYKYTKNILRQNGLGTTSVYENGIVISSLSFSDRSDTIIIQVSDNKVEMIYDINGKKAAITLKTESKNIIGESSGKEVLRYETDNIKLVRYVGSEGFVEINYFYNKAGLIDYSIATISDIINRSDNKIIKKLTYKYTYYED